MVVALLTKFMNAENLKELVGMEVVSVEDYEHENGVFSDTGTLVKLADECGKSATLTVLHGVLQMAQPETK